MIRSTPLFMVGIVSHWSTKFLKKVMRTLFIYLLNSFDKRRTRDLILNFGIIYVHYIRVSFICIRKLGQWAIVPIINCSLQPELPFAQFFIISFSSLCSFSGQYMLQWFYTCMVLKHAISGYVDGFSECSSFGIRNVIPYNLNFRFIFEGPQPSRGIVEYVPWNNTSIIYPENFSWIRSVVLEF